MNDPLSDVNRILDGMAASEAKAARPQITRAELAGLTPAQIVAAKADGLLNELLGRSAAN